jgi:hypothetical protein
MRALVSSLEVCIVGADNFAVEAVPPVDTQFFHPCHQHLIMDKGIHLQEGHDIRRARGA